ncbi:MAG: T9SS type A sorting domain-containing protein [Bacteroidales bacterium]|nr:T9SS type A sorting domain-containing protein [Bacteroidales bacterium]
MKPKLLFSAIFLCLAGMAYGQWTYTNLSEAKLNMGSASLGNKVWFGGGTNWASYLADVELYDISTGYLEPAGNLFVSRFFVGGSVSCGSKIFFAGGYDDAVSYNIVDIFDTLTQEWSVELLSVDRFSLAAVSHGNIVMFAGGIQMQGAPNFKNTVDIYNIETGEWETPTTLSQARGGIAATVAGNLAIFAGGWINVSGVTSNKVDIYNFTTKTWSQATLSQARAYASAATVGSKVIIAGGITSINNPTNRVDIYDVETGIWTQANLSTPRSFNENGATINGKVYFPGGGIFHGSGFNTASNVIDVYDAASNSWSVMNLQTARVEHSVIAVGDYLVVAGGRDNYGPLSSVEIYYDAPPSNIIHVPGDYPTIQAGINAATPGDTVLVADGLYYENINMMGKKPLVVASHFIMTGDTNHIANTIINGSQGLNPDKGSVIIFESGEDTTSIVCGFTITAGKGTIIPTTNYRAGGGVFVIGSGCKLENNYIEYNQMVSDNYTLGGGICAGGPTAPLPWIVLRNNRINHNTAISNYDQGSGGGMEIYYNLILENNQISYNKTKGINFAIGGGARLLTAFGPIELNVRDNHVTHNIAESGGQNTILVISGGVTLNGDVSGTFANNVVSDNQNITENNALNYGPGLCVDEAFAGNLLVENNFLINNSFTGGTCIGGGLSIYNSRGIFQNNVIMGNSATNGGGIAIEENLSYNAILINNTVTGNNANTGTGLWASTAKAVVVNTIIYNNTPPGGNSIFEQNSNLEVHYSDIEADGIWPGEGNLNCDPSFLEDGYHLDYTCQLLNMGTAAFDLNGVMYYCPEYDIDGEERPFGGAGPEIGADELMTLVSIKNPVAVHPTAVTLYPNPASDWITISTEDGIVIRQVTLTNRLGQEVCTGLPETNRLDVSGLSPGLYILSVLTNRGEVKQKVIIE